MRRNYKNHICRLQFIDSTRFMARLLSNLVNNLAEGIDKIKCNYKHDIKKCETSNLHTKIATVFLDTRITASLL